MEDTFPSPHHDEASAIEPTGQRCSFCLFPTLIYTEDGTVEARNLLSPAQRVA